MINISAYIDKSDAPATCNPIYVKDDSHGLNIMGYYIHCRRIAIFKKLNTKGNWTGGFEGAEMAESDACEHAVELLKNYFKMVKK